MNLKTTLVLLVFAAAGGALAWFATDVPQRLGLRPAPVAVASGDTLRVLEDELTADKLRAIEVRQGEQVVRLERDADGAWSLPGKWPTRQGEVKQLVALLTGLRSRF